MPSALRAPQHHGGLLLAPTAEEIPARLAANHDALASTEVEIQQRPPLKNYPNARSYPPINDILGTPLTTLRAQARREVFTLAREYQREAGEPVPDTMHGRWIVAGHQPELFHPGVWVKNFALAHWARALGATSLNLVIDNDVVKSTKLRLPGSHRLESIPFDRLPAGVPYEEAAVQDEALFDAVPEHVRLYSKDWPFAPLVDAFWHQVRRHRDRTTNMGERFAAARRALERRWGYAPLELPLSRACSTRVFAHFAVFLLEHAESLQRIYNEAVHEYRRRNALRSENHPVPDLVRDGDWLEVPLWTWSAEQPRRQRLFMRRWSGAFELRAGAEVFARLTGSVEARIEQWQALASLGYKLRPRALMTTLWSRLFLGDLFVHGIGGAKYDEVTDNLMRRLFGVAPPSFAALSATLWLPLPRYPDADAERRRLEILLRDLHYNPQRHIKQGATSLVAEKQTLIDTHPATHEGRVERFHRLQAITETLRPAVAEPSAAAAQHLARVEEESRRHHLHAWREYAFCLYPEDMLREFYTAHFPP